MASTDTSARPAPAALEASTLCGAFATTVRERPDQVALRTAGGDGSLTWTQYEQRVRRIAAGLAARGVRRGDRVALLLRNVPESHLVDAAAMHLGAATLSLDPAGPAERSADALGASGARIAITEAAFAESLAGVATLTDVVSIDGGTGATSSLAELEAGGDPDFDLAAAAAAVDPDDVALLVHVPGEDGTPTGVLHSHASLLSTLRSTEAFAPPTLGGPVVSFLPASNVAERVISHYGPLVFGHEVTCCPDAERLAETLGEVRPTRLVAVPSTLEALAREIEGAAASSPDLAAAIDKGRDTVDAIQAGCPPQFHPGVGPEAEEVLAALRARLGLDRLEWFGVDASPAPDLLRLLHAVGLEALEFWGVPEAIFATSNPAEGAKLGTIGQALPGVEVRLADDGELLVRSGAVTVGYDRDAERTAATLVDGWLRTGVSATKDYEGFLTLADRPR